MCERVSVCATAPGLAFNYFYNLLYIDGTTTRSTSTADLYEEIGASKLSVSPLGARYVRYRYWVPYRYRTSGEYNSNYRATRTVPVPVPLHTTGRNSYLVPVPVQSTGWYRYDDG